MMSMKHNHEFWSNIVAPRMLGALTVWLEIKHQTYRGAYSLTRKRSLLKFAERIFEWIPDKFIASAFATYKIHHITKVTEGGLYCTVSKRFYLPS